MKFKINQRVMTPAGPGTVKAVGDQVNVHLDGAAESTSSYFKAGELQPEGEQAAAAPDTAPAPKKKAAKKTAAPKKAAKKSASK